MKKIFLICLGVAIFSGVVMWPSIALSQTNVDPMALVAEGQSNVGVWKQVISDVKTNGFSFGWLLSLAIVILGSLTILTLAADWIMTLLIKFLPDEADAKLYKAKMWASKALGWITKISGWLSATKTKTPEEKQAEKDAG